MNFVDENVTIGWDHLDQTEHIPAARQSSSQSLLVGLHGPDDWGQRFGFVSLLAVRMSFQTFRPEPPRGSADLLFPELIHRPFPRTVLDDLSLQQSNQLEEGC